MEDLAADFIIENNEPLELEAEITEPEHFDCVFELYAAGTTWGSISGTLSNQTDLQAALDLKADKTELESVSGALADSITAVSDNLQSEATTRADNDVILQNNINTVSNNLTAEIGNRTSADTILQSNINAIDNKYISITGGLSDSITAIDNTINNYGDIVNYDAADFATSIQGALADTALQPNDNISELNNDANYIINSASGRSVNIYGLRNSGLGAINVGEGSAAEGDYTTAIGYSARSTATRAIQIGKGTNSTAGTLSVGFDNGGNYILLSGITGLIPDDRLSSNIARAADIPTFDTNQMAAINSGANTTNIGQITTNTNAISNEVTDRQNADIALQNQIDAIVSSSDVFDIVGTYAELQAYDIATVPVNDIIKVLVDSTHNNAATYYRCVENGGVKSWSYIGSEGAYYTKGEADAAFVPQTRTVNGKALNNNITLNASDVGALPDSTVIPTVNNSTITIQKNGAAVDTFTLNQATAKTINITVPTDTDDLTNGAGFISGITSSDVIAALGFTPYNSTNPNGYITSSALSGYATESFVTSQGYITGITSSDIITALSYTPYDASNPDGYITSSALTPYALISSLATVATSGSYNDLTDLPTIPTVGNGTITINQGGSLKGTFTVNQSGNTTIDLDAGGSITNYVTTDTAQNITGVKTFVGQKMIEFKQSAAADKLGFTCFNTSNTEIGAFEYRPNTIGSGALFNINVPYSSTSYVGFRYWGTAVNVVAPKVATAGTYYIPVNITDGNTTVTASNAGVLNISSLLPDLSNYLQNTATDTNALSILSNNSNGTATTLIGADTQCSAAAQYGTAIGYHAQLGAVSSAIQLGYGTNSTANSFNVGFFNNTSTHYNWQLLDGTTGLIPDARLSSNIARTNQIPTVPTNISAFTNDSGYITSSALAGYATESFVTSQGYITGITSSDVTTALGYTPVNKAGDTMTGGLLLDGAIYSKNGTFPTATPSSNTYLVGYELYGNNTRLGLMGLGYYASGKTALYLQHERTVSGTIKYSALQVGIDDSGNGYASCPKPQSSSDTNDIATTNWVDDKLYYRAGDTVTNLSNYIVAGYLTSSKTRLRFAIPLPKRMNKISSVTINTLVINARQGQAGYLPSATWNAKTGSTVSASFTDNMLQIECYSTTAFTSFTNNVIVNVEFDSFKCTFS